MTTIILIRCGHTDWNASQRIQGTVDIPLNDTGRQKAEELSSTLKTTAINAIYSSGLTRSVETAQIIGRNHDIKPRKIRELNEIDQGLWQGLCVKDIKKRYKKQFALWKMSPFSTKPPQGEGLKEAYDRTISAVQRLIDKHRDETICIVSHEVVLALVKCHFTGQDINAIWNHTPEACLCESLNVE